jgi:hypothetical protein
VAPQKGPKRPPLRGREAGAIKGSGKRVLEMDQINRPDMPCWPSKMESPGGVEIPYWIESNPLKRRVSYKEIKFTPNEGKIEILILW